MRLLLWGRGISALGDGLWFTLWAIYFTRVVGLSATAVGVGMAIAAGVGLASVIPLGSLADRFDARIVLLVITVVQALAMASYLLVSEFVGFLVATIVFVGLTNGGHAVRTALVAGLVTDNAARVTALAQLRVAQHVGYAAGAGAGALVLTADRLPVYQGAVVVNAVTFGVLAVLTAFVPRARTERPPKNAARRALRDLPYVAVVSTTAVLAMCWAMLSTGLPLWIAGSTSLPLGLSGIVVIISSVGIAALQIPAARFARTPTQAARTVVWSGLALAASCVLVSITGPLAGALGVTVIIAAAALHLTGELGYVSASWGLSVNLMAEDARGAYQAVSQTATATVQMFGPAVFTLALSGLGAVGWLVIGAIFACVAAPVPALTRWAVRTRSADAGVVHQ
jgi:MFS family permease